MSNEFKVAMVLLVILVMSAVVYAAYFEQSNHASVESSDMTAGAIAAIKSDDRVKDFFLDEGAYTHWNVGVLNPQGHQRHAFALYICSILKQHNLDLDGQFVRVVDIDQVTNQNKTPRDASLGKVECATGERLDR